MKQITIQMSVTQWARLGGLTCRPRAPLSSLTLPGSLASPFHLDVTISRTEMVLAGV